MKVHFLLLIDEEVVWENDEGTIMCKTIMPVSKLLKEKIISLQKKGAVIIGIEEKGRGNLNFYLIEYRDILPGNVDLNTAILPMTQNFYERNGRWPRVEKELMIMIAAIDPRPERKAIKGFLEEKDWNENDYQTILQAIEELQTAKSSFFN